MSERVSTRPPSGRRKHGNCIMTNQTRLPVAPCLDTAMRFLTTVRPRGPWTLTAIHPVIKGAPTETFIGAAEVGKMRSWIKEKNRNAGIYFCANPTGARLHRRPREEDIRAYQYAALDFDPMKDESPSECRARIFKLLDRYGLPPTFRWSTGNGVQALWRIKPAVMLGDRATRLRCRNANLGLIEALKADHTQSLEHLFRVAGTINHPNETKLTLGRKVTSAGNFEHHPENVYALDDLPAAKQGAIRAARGLPEPPGGWDAPDGVDDAVFYLRTTGDVAAEGRSGTAIRTALRCRDHGVSENLTFELMWHHWVPRCEYVWVEDELHGKIQRAYERAQNDPGCRTKAYRLLLAKEDFSHE